MRAFPAVPLRTHHLFADMFLVGGGEMSGNVSNSTKASGEATYTSDIGVGTEQLYAATVPSSHARAHITKIDLSAAGKVRVSSSEFHGITRIGT